MFNLRCIFIYVSGSSNTQLNYVQLESKIHLNKCEFVEYSQWLTYALNYYVIIIRVINS